MKRTFFAEAAYFLGMLLPAPGAEIMERGNYFDREIDISL